MTKDDLKEAVCDLFSSGELLIIPCDECSGTGQILEEDEWYYTLCENCNGAGFTVISSENEALSGDTFRDNGKDSSGDKSESSVHSQ